MGDIILLTYGHDHKHKQFIKYWREFRQRHPEAKNTPELARVEIYNLRFDDDPKDTYLVKKELNYFNNPKNEKFFFFKRNGLIGKTMCKIFSIFFERKFNPYVPVKEIPKKPYFGDFGCVPIFEKKDSYEWNKGF